MNEVGYVLDASALLAAMLGERAAHRLSRRIFLCLHQRGESVRGRGQTVGTRLPDVSIQESLSDLDLDVRDFNTAQALRSGALRNVTNVKGLSHGDRACLALAGELNAIALTTDAAWAEIELGIAVPC